MSALSVTNLTTRKSQNVSAEVVKVTPKLATQWLTRNVRNRKLKPGAVSAYARDMAAGRWLLSGQPIIFDWDGALSDGQNRLHAVIKSGATVPMMIVRNVEPDAQNVMDSGVKRSASDSLVLEGRSNPTIMTAAARFALADPSAGFGAEGIAKANVTNSEILAWVNDQGEDLAAAANIAAHYYPSIDVPPSVLCVAWMRLSSLDYVAAGEFFSTVADCQTEGVGDPRLTLIKRLQNIRRDRERVNQAEYLSLLFRAWNAWRASQSLRSLPIISRSGQVKVPDPK